MGESDQNTSAVVSGNYLKTLVVYEVDLGLNNVYRKFAEPLPKTAHALIPVPGSFGVSEDDVEGPGGVLVACENFIVYKKQGHEDRKCSIPIRLDQNKDSGVFIIQNEGFFNSSLGVVIFMQSEHGDIYKVSLDQQGLDVLGISV